MEKVSTNLTKRCKKCGEDRELSLFKYKLTRAQARAQGYTGNHIVEHEGKTCNLCKKKPRPLSKLRPNELQARVDAGDISDFMVQKILEKRKADRSARLSAIAQRRWEREHDAQWNDYLKPLKHEMKLVYAQHYKATNKGQTQLANYSHAYMNVLLRVEALHRIKADARAEVDWSHDWRKDVTDEEYKNIEDLENALPTPVRMKMRGALLLRQRRFLNKSREEQRLGQELALKLRETEDAMSHSVDWDSM